MPSDIGRGVPLSRQLTGSEWRRPSRNQPRTVSISTPVILPCNLRDRNGRSAQRFKRCGSYAGPRDIDHGSSGRWLLPTLGLLSLNQQITTAISRRRVSKIRHYEGKAASWPCLCVSPVQHLGSGFQSRGGHPC